MHHFNSSQSEFGRMKALKVVEQLSTFHNIGKAGRIHGTRELVIPNTPYIAVYWIKSNKIEVLRVLHTSVKWSDNF